MTPPFFRIPWIVEMSRGKGYSGKSKAAPGRGGGSQSDEKKHMAVSTMQMQPTIKRRFFTNSDMVENLLLTKSKKSQ